MRSRILVVPAVPELDALARVIANLAHHLAHVAPERIAIFVQGGLVSEAAGWLDAPTVPAAIDPGVTKRIAALRGAISLRPWPGEVASLASTSDVVLDWDPGVAEGDPWASATAEHRPGRTRFAIDLRDPRSAASALADVARVLGAGRRFLPGEADRLRALLDRLGPAEVACLVDAELPAGDLVERDLPDGPRIVDAAAVLDDELVARVRPDVVVLADEVLVGPSVDARRFRERLAGSQRDLGFGILTTELIAGQLRIHVPEIADQIIGLRVGPTAWPTNLDLRAHPAVRSYPDALTMLMLPLAASVARSILLIGFDRADGATLEHLFRRLEERGTEVRALTSSHVPALARRDRARSGGGRVDGPSQPVGLVSLTPDWVDEFGHFGPFERRVHASAEQAGETHVALASAALRPAEGWQLPAFSEATFISSDGTVPLGRRFDAELRAAFTRLELDERPTAFLYTADVWHLAAIIAIAPEYPRLRFVVNLMRIHGWIARARERPDPQVEELVDLLRQCLAAAVGTTVTVTVDSETLRDDVRVLTEIDVEVWPMIAVSRFAGSASAAPSNRSVHLVSPVHAVEARGFPELVELAERLAPRIEAGQMRITARWPAPAAGPRVRELAEQLEARHVQLVRDNVSDEAFAALIASADIVLIPYRTSHFRTRTSAVAVDALLAGKPIVAVRGTWAGDLVEAHAAGRTYADGSIAEMEEAVIEVAERIGEYRARMVAVREVVAVDYAPERLIEFLRGPSDAARPPAPDRAAATELATRVGIIRRRHASRCIEDDAARVTAAVRSDDQQRIIDTLRDEIDLLRRGVAYWRRAATENRD